MSNPRRLAQTIEDCRKVQSRVRSNPWTLARHLDAAGLERLKVFALAVLERDDEATKEGMGDFLTLLRAAFPDAPGVYAQYRDLDEVEYRRAKRVRGVTWGTIRHAILHCWAEATVYGQRPLEEARVNGLRWLAWGEEQFGWSKRHPRPFGVAPPAGCVPLGDNPMSRRMYARLEREGWGRISLCGRKLLSGRPRKEVETDNKKVTS